MSNADVNIPSYTCHGTCHVPTIPPVDVTAAVIGSDYNIAAEGNYTSGGSTDNGTPMSDFDMSGSAMTGGASQNVQVVAQADVNSAESQLSTPSSNTQAQSLEGTLKQDGLTPIVTTFATATPTDTPSAAVGVEANSITVTATYTYSMYGVEQSDLATLVSNSVNQQINPNSQSVLDNGASSANFTFQTANANSAEVTMQAVSVVGPKIDSAALLKKVAGQKSGDIASTIEQIPGVTNVTVKYSPFWVSSTPKNTSKITIIIEKKDGSAP